MTFTLRPPTIYIRPHFLGPMGGLKMEGLLYSLKVKTITSGKPNGGIEMYMCTLKTNAVHLQKGTIAITILVEMG